MKKSVLGLGFIIMFGIASVSCSAFLKWSFVKNSAINIEVEKIEQRQSSAGPAAFVRDMFITVKVTNNSKEKVHIGKIRAWKDYPVGSDLEPGSSITRELGPFTIGPNRKEIVTIEVYDEKDVLNWIERGLIFHTKF